MTLNLIRKVALAASIVLMSLIVPNLLGGLALAQTTLAVLRGITREERGLLPFPNARVIVHSIPEGSDRVVLSDAHGSFVVDDLVPGAYRMAAAQRSANRLAKPHRRTCWRTEPER
jgi:hypothetical protein